jgi:hypothetical protein
MTKKLTLTCETLRSFQETDLRQAFGGKPVAGLTQPRVIAEPTYKCTETC